MQFRPACTAVSVAGVTIFTTFLLQPTKCNFLRYVCEPDDGGQKKERSTRRRKTRKEEGEGEKSRNARVESIIVGMEVPRWEGYNERLAIFLDKYFSPFRNGRPVPAGPPPVVARGPRHSARCRSAAIQKLHEATLHHKVLNALAISPFFFCRQSPRDVDALGARRASTMIELLRGGLATLGVDRKFRRTIKRRAADGG